MKNFTLFRRVFTLLVILSVCWTHAQVTGDFRSLQTGNWNSASTWQVYNGSAWVSASQFPGQAASTAHVSVLAGHTVTNTTAATYSVGNVTVTGMLKLDASLVLSATSSLLIPGGTIFWNANPSRLTLPAGASVIITGYTGSNGLQAGKPCSNSKELFIGNAQYTACEGNGNMVGDFSEINNGGGSFRSQPAASPSVFCSGNSVILSGYENTLSDLKYQWAVVSAPSGYVMPGSGNTRIFGPLTLSIPGNYIFSLAVTKSGFTVTEEVSVTVNPAYPASVSISASPGNVICAGTPVTFTATPVNGGPSPSYQWKINGNNAGTDSPSFTPPAVKAGDVITAVMISNSPEPCLSSSPATSNTITIAHQTAVYNGSWDLPPAPNLSAEIRTSYSSAGKSLSVCALRVTNNASAHLESGDSFTVQHGVTVDPGSMLTIASGANLVQVADTGVNSGNISVLSDIKIGETRTQYNFLVSPVNFMSGESFKSIYPGITGVLYYNETNNFFFNSTGVNIPGRGLAVREPAKPAVPAGSAKVTAQYKGVPQNGSIGITVANSDISNGGLGYNLVGNPYPSNIDLVKLYNLNGGKNTVPQTVSPNISSTFYFWDNEVNNGVEQTQQGSNYKGQAYALFNVLTGSNGTGIAAGSLNGGLITGNKTPTHIVKTGQGFMTRALTVNYSLKYDNSIRTTNEATPDFLGKGKRTDDRFWIRMTSPAGVTSNIAVVYFDAGQGSFGPEDSESRGGSDELYSITEDRKLAINGKSGFLTSDTVPLGTKHFVTGGYRISLGEREGVFAGGQNIYLKDRETGIVANLSEGEYAFAAVAGERTGRFEIIYKPGAALSTDNTVKEDLAVYKSGSNFIVKTNRSNITELEMYDSSGRLAYEVRPQGTEVTINTETLSPGMYILNINRNGEIISRKIIK